MEARLEKVEAKIPILLQRITDLTTSFESKSQQLMSMLQNLMAPTTQTTNNPPKTIPHFKNHPPNTFTISANNTPNSNIQTPKSFSSSINTEPINQKSLPIYTESKPKSSAITTIQPSTISINTIPPLNVTKTIQKCQTQQTHYTVKTISLRRYFKTNKEPKTRMKGENELKTRQRTLASLEESINSNYMVCLAKDLFKNRRDLPHPVRPPDWFESVEILKERKAAKPYEEEGNNLSLCRAAIEVTVKTEVDKGNKLRDVMAKKGGKVMLLDGAGVHADEAEQDVKVGRMRICLGKKQNVKREDMEGRQMARDYGVWEDGRLKQAHVINERAILMIGKLLLLSNQCAFVDPSIECCYVEQWAWANIRSKEEAGDNMGLIFFKVGSQEGGIPYGIVGLLWALVFGNAGIFVSNGQIDGGITSHFLRNSALEIEKGKVSGSCLISLSSLLPPVLNCHIFTFKYQLPKEELDSLNFLTTDGDLGNMIMEYGRSCHNKSRFCLFLLPSTQPMDYLCANTHDWSIIWNRGFSYESINCFLELNDENGPGDSIPVAVDMAVKRKELYSLLVPPILETTLFYGSAYSWVNLPSIEAYVEDGRNTGGDSHEHQVVRIEEVAHSVVAGGVGTVVRLTEFPLPPPPLLIRNPIGRWIATVGENANRVISDDEKIDHGVIRTWGPMHSLRVSIAVKGFGGILLLEGKFQGGTSINLTPSTYTIQYDALEKCKQCTELIANTLQLEGFSRDDALINADGGDVLVVGITVARGRAPSIGLCRHELEEHVKVSATNLLPKTNGVLTFAGLISTHLEDKVVLHGRSIDTNLDTN